MKLFGTIFLLISGVFLHTGAMGSTISTIPEGFVYLDEAIPSIRLSARYAGNDNFIGQPIEGYLSSRIVLTTVAVDALQKAQNDFLKDGYSVVVYDGYRPQRAVDHFMKWRKDLNDQRMKGQYYPRIDKEKVLELGYVAEKSGHSRGSTLDISIIPKDQQLSKLQVVKRQLTDGFTILHPQDGTVDMGSPFDLFDAASHYNSPLILPDQNQNRQYVKDVMERHGFKSYSKEWWHFTLENEPYKNIYFDFVVPGKPSEAFKLVLLDRDGVINQDLPTSVRSIDEFQLLPNVGKAINLLNSAHVPVVVVTNQAVVGRGVISETDLKDIHQHMTRLLAQENAFLDAILYCTDVEIEPNQRRKPAPGMLLEAIREFKSTPESTVMIGDAMIDMQAAFAAHCQRILVQSGKGQLTLKDPSLDNYQPLKVYDNLYSAVLAILAFLGKYDVHT